MTAMPTKRKFTKSEAQPVLFRVWKKSVGSGVIALFPTEAADHRGNLVNSYEHVGQHGGADLLGVIGNSRPAKPAEYADLKRELERIGYKLVVKQRTSAEMRKEMLRSLRK